MNRFEDMHGGPDRWGVPLHDFSTNSNACGPCPAAQAALRDADASRYPDPGYTNLRRELARFHGVAAARIVLAASASEFIFRITAAMASRGVRAVELPLHGYGDYAKAARAWRLPVQHASGESDGPRLVWRCDPSSPLGQGDAQLGADVDRLADDAVCVLDLAYEPLRLDGALALGAHQRDRVWQLWTPNKALGLTGVRAAYAIAPNGAEETTEALNALAPSWPVGAHGVALLRAWTSRDAQQWLADSLATLRVWKRAQQALCGSFGWTCAPSAANFFCAAPPVADVPALCDALRAQGIKLRDTASFGLPGRVRLGVLGPQSQRALGEALASVDGARG